MILQSKRLFLRALEITDKKELSDTLQDPSVMYAYEHAFSDEEVHQWLHTQLSNYKTYGFGLWAVIEKQTGTFIGQCGITMQKCHNTLVPEIGYLFKKKYWHKGYATEAAIACKKYAFEQLGFSKVYSIIRDNNLPSQAVAKRNGMTSEGMLIKEYYGIKMPHVIYAIEKNAPERCSLY